MQLPCCGLRQGHFLYILLALGGPDGELGASMRYLNQRYTMPMRELQGILTDIGTEEPVQRCCMPE